MRPTQLFLSVVLFAIALKSTRAVREIECEVFDHTYGTPDTRFGREVGTEYGADALLAAAEPGGRGYDFILLEVESFLANGRSFVIATTNRSQILVNADYLQTFPGNSTDEFTGIVYFTSGLVWERTGNGTAPAGLMTGIAVYMRLTSGWEYKGWPRRGSGLRWDEGYAITANFLEDCGGLRLGFASFLIAMMLISLRSYSGSLWMNCGWTIS
ncbi:hypothetical protein ACJRO7_021251 [Eucalyptus globulus]|uniref:Uncharacterized protein n=1 Tax=Eucalyptus globulus TaxID=34317 RepID=A0ABD3KP41_EUCGL